ncbi:hypothetical protein GGD81_003479 [Rhodobium orientis]|uniref:CopL family metal-binding regulatory protein n=1 Tax=Rhodobium orientis TaxID=34017 RepID=A0A327JH98_9HYPH|nr:hypothetical protein [Rhodobium orientis]MBB4304420.1 hypothetical protein [Rhodobium orientis]MBK5952026.1 hypothetical protein [Rhodobium orientis]RAI25800.1 hypothetical protein CH339_16995 [Rhodobium orientis]
MLRRVMSLILSFALVFSAAGHLAMASRANIAAPASHAAMHHAPDADALGAISGDRMTGPTVTAADPWNCCQPSPAAHACAVDAGIPLPAATMPRLCAGTPAYARADDQAFGRAPAIPLKPPRAA